MLLTNAVNAPHLAMLGAFLESPPSYPPVKFLTNGGTLEENIRKLCNGSHGFQPWFALNYSPLNQSNAKSSCFDTTSPQVLQRHVGAPPKHVACGDAMATPLGKWDELDGIGWL
jgi:hypothetical protein